MLFLNKQKDLFSQPLHFQFVFGVLGGAPFSPGYLQTLLELAPPGSTWSVCGVARQQFQAAMVAAAWGGHIRVGLEDNLYIEKGVLAKSSAEQVEKAVRFAQELGLEVASPDEARKILGLKGLDKVNY